MVRSAVLAVSALAVATLTGCGGSTEPPSDAASSAIPSSASATPSASTAAACARQQTAPRPELVRQLPAGLPIVTGWQPTRVAVQGRTREVSGVLRGELGDLVRVRDDAAAALTGAGYRQVGTDQEAGYEAEAEFEGPQEVTVKVRPLCRDYLALSYTVRQ